MGDWQFGSKSELPMKLFTQGEPRTSSALGKHKPQGPWLRERGTDDAALPLAVAPPHQSLSVLPTLAAPSGSVGVSVSKDAGSQHSVFSSLPILHALPRKCHPLPSFHRLFCLLILFPQPELKVLVDTAPPHGDTWVPQAQHLFPKSYTFSGTCSVNDCTTHWVT